MSWNISNEEATIYKTDKGNYKAYVRNKIIDANGEEKSEFMKIDVGFRKGIDLKNKTKIEITNAFLTFYSIQTKETDENGNFLKKQFPKIMIMSFEILQDGIDEPMHTSQKSNKTEENFSDFDFNSEDDDLPF